MLSMTVEGRALLDICQSVHMANTGEGSYNKQKYVQDAGVLQSKVTNWMKLSGAQSAFDRAVIRLFRATLQEENINEPSRTSLSQGRCMTTDQILTESK